MKKIVAGALLLGSLVVAGCNTSSGGNVNADVNKQVKKREAQKVDPKDLIYPTLEIETAGKKEMLNLKSQIAKYTDKDKKKIELIVSDNMSLSCDNMQPALKEGERMVKVKLESGAAITKEEYGKAEDKKASVEMKNDQGNVNLANSTVSFIVTEINDAIIKGDLSLNADGTTVKGGLFTAICQ